MDVPSAWNVRGFGLPLERCVRISGTTAPTRRLTVPRSSSARYSPITLRRHPAWQRGPAEIADRGGADADPPRSPDAPIHQSRERSLRRGAPLPRGVHALACASQVGTKLRDCHQSKQLTLLRLLEAADLHVCAPGRTRTCNLRIRSRPTTVHAVAAGCRSCWSGRVSRPADAALSCGVARGGMTNGMTTPPRAWRRRLLHSNHLSQFGNGPRRPVRIACCNRHIPCGMRILQRLREGRARGQRGPRA